MLVQHAARIYRSIINMNSEILEEKAQITSQGSTKDKCYGCHQRAYITLHKKMCNAPFAKNVQKCTKIRVKLGL